jgi:ATP-dependent Lon protease
MKTIQKELGDEDLSRRDADDYSGKLEALSLPEDIVTEAAREIDRLRHIQPSSSEYQVIKTYLDRFFALPWGQMTEEHIDLATVRTMLDDGHFGLDKVKERILEFLAVRKLNPDHKGPILCFVGPPGVGKTSLGKSIAESIGREFFRISVGGVRDEAEIRGHRRTYVGALPGKILNGLTRAGAMNPLLMLDEIDKIGSTIAVIRRQRSWRYSTQSKTGHSPIIISIFLSTCRRSFSLSRPITCTIFQSHCSTAWKSSPSRATRKLRNSRLPKDT